MALKNLSANCFRKFKRLQLTFQVVIHTVRMSDKKFAKSLFCEVMLFLQLPTTQIFTTKKGRECSIFGDKKEVPSVVYLVILNYCAFEEVGTGSVEWEWLPILKQSLIQTPVQFSRDPYVVEIPGRMGICMPYVIYPINSSRVFVRGLFYIQIA